MLPLQRDVRHATSITEFLDGSEQAWAERAPLGGFTLALTNIGGYDLSNVLEFFRSQGGRFGVWDLPLNGTTYNNISFDQDEIQWTEKSATRFTLSLRCLQMAA